MQKQTTIKLTLGLSGFRIEIVKSFCHEINCLIYVNTDKKCLLGKKIRHVFSQLIRVGCMYGWAKNGIHSRLEFVS